MTGLRLGQIRLPHNARAPTVRVKSLKRNWTRGARPHRAAEAAARSEVEQLKRSLRPGKPISTPHGGTGSDACDCFRLDTASGALPGRVRQRSLRRYQGTCGLPIVAVLAALPRFAGVVRHLARRIKHKFGGIRSIDLMRPQKSCSK